MSEMRDYHTLEEDNQITQINPYVFNSTFKNLTTSDMNSYSRLKTIKIQDSIYLHIPDHLLNKAIEIEKKLFIIKLICLFDYIANLCYFLDGYKYGLIISGVSLTGYISTVYHKKYLFLFYLTYQYLLCSSKFIAICFFIMLANNVDLQEKYEHNQTLVPYHFTDQTDYIFLIFWSFIFFVMQLWICVYCTSYFNLIPTNKDKSQIFLTFDELV